MISMKRFCFLLFLVNSLSISVHSLQYPPGGRTFPPPKTKLWTSKTIPYVIDSSIEKDSTTILSAMEVFNGTKCIIFKPRTDEFNYVTFSNHTGCSILTGMKGGNQMIPLNTNCRCKGIILQALLHTTGVTNKSNKQTKINVEDPAHCPKQSLGQYEMTDIAKQYGC